MTDYLLIVRHGDTEANVNDIDAGPLDYPLTRQGVKQVRFIARAISKIKVSAVYSSPVFRAVETARILARPHGLQVKTLEELTEAKLKPEFVGKKGRHHILTDPEAFTETNSELTARTLKAIEIVKSEAEGNVIMVSHGDVITAMLESIVERRISGQKYYVFHSEPASLSIVEVKDRPFLVLFNYHRKLLSEL
ncbi:MAG TPA: histidine phosphatase family protein [Candidatus Limnocylindrales bacterium]|nr:histidine phosphatase family protein [Candidatus Limnocylindrales bacterium]